MGHSITVSLCSEFKVLSERVPLAECPPLGQGRIGYHTLQLAKTAHNEEKGSKEAIREVEWNKMTKKQSLSSVQASQSMGVAEGDLQVETGGQVLSFALLPTLLEY